MSFCLSCPPCVCIQPLGIPGAPQWTREGCGSKWSKKNTYSHSLRKPLGALRKPHLWFFWQIGAPVDLKRGLGSPNGLGEFAGVSCPKRVFTPAAYTSHWARFAHHFYRFCARLGYQLTSNVSPGAPPWTWRGCGGKWSKKGACSHGLRVGSLGMQLDFRKPPDPCISLCCMMFRLPSTQLSSCHKCQPPPQSSSSDGLLLYFLFGIFQLEMKRREFKFIVTQILRVSPSPASKNSRILHTWRATPQVANLMQMP